MEMDISTALRTADTKYGTYVGGPSAVNAVTVFKGIPYAKPPVGEYRWREPQPLDVPSDPAAVGPIECFKFANAAIQDPMPTNAGPAHEGYLYNEPTSEDCLYLNIWTPAKSATDKLPVMVWIHGGAYIGGQSFATATSGEVIGMQGCILVSVEYRLGIFGFLTHPELDAQSPNGVSGNYGTLDQVAALKWVKENIAAFGGDPDNVTVFGQSAGSHSSQAMCTTPLARGLFSRAILESGPSMVNAELLPMRQLAESEELHRTVLEAAGYKSFDEVRAADPYELQMRTNKAIYFDLQMSLLGLPFTPVVDGYVFNETLGEAAAHGNVADVEYILGHTDECTLDAPMPYEFYEPWLSSFGQDRDRVAQALDISTQEQLDAINPGGFRGKLVTASIAFAEARAKAGGKPVYYYYFARPLPGDGAGADHSAELFYVFNNLSFNWRPYTGVDFDIARTLNKYWTNFAKTGDPNSGDVPLWKAYDAQAPARLMVKDSVHMDASPMPAWRAVLVEQAQK